MARVIQTTFKVDATEAFKVLRFQESHRLGLPAALEIDAAFIDY